MSSLPGLTPQIGFTRFAAHNTAQLGQARVAVQSIHLRKKLLTKKMDARVISAFTRVFDALLPAHDPLGNLQTMPPRLKSRRAEAAAVRAVRLGPRHAVSARRDDGTILLR